MAAGYTGKILRINLNDLSHSIEERDEYFYRTFMGGSAMASYFLLTEIEPGTDPLGADNTLVLMNSVLTGISIPGANRLTMATKSPLNEGFGEAEAGGFIAYELKKAGWDGIVINGKAPHPVYLWISDGKVEFKNAEHLWGQDSGFAHTAILDELDDKRIRTLAIGQAGENLVRYACVVHDCRHTFGRSGMGAVMGSKNLKAMAVRGTQKPEVHDKDKLKELRSYFAKNRKEHPVCEVLSYGGTMAWDIEDLNADGVLPTKNFHSGSFDQVEGMSFEKMKDTVFSDQYTCHACPVRCKPICEGGKYDIDPAFGGPQYETAGAFGSLLLVDDIEVISKANELCNRYTLDTIDTGVTIAFAMECFENGLLDKEKTDGLDLHFGNGEAVIELIDKIAFKKGFGALLAEGSHRAAEAIGNGAEKFSCAVKKQGFAMHEPRGKNNIGLAFALSPTGADHIEAAHDFPFEEGKFAIPDLYPVGILKGVPAQGLTPKKVRWWVLNQHIYSLLNSLSTCFFTAGPARLYTMNQIVDMVAAATGWETSLYELMILGERTTTLARVFNAREGFDRKDDQLPDRIFEPLEGGPLKGYKWDRAEFNRALDLYYEMMGWDAETGVPREAKLHHLNIADLDQFKNPTNENRKTQSA